MEKKQRNRAIEAEIERRAANSGVPPELHVYEMKVTNSHLTWSAIAFRIYRSPPVPLSPRICFSTRESRLYSTSSPASTRSYWFQPAGGVIKPSVLLSPFFGSLTNRLPGGSLRKLKGKVG